jgi:outer membrane protein assembly factor BamA
MKSAPLNTLFILLLFTNVGLGQTQKPAIVESISFYGNKVSDSQVSSWFGLKKGDSFSAESLPQNAEKLLTAYANAGQPFTKIDSISYFIKNQTRVTVFVYLNEGKKITLGEIDLKGVDSERASAIKNRFDSRAGQQPDTGKLGRDLDDALLQFEIRGYPFSRFELQSMSLDSVEKETQSLGFTFNTITGPQLLINEIQIAGNELTKKNVILREIRIKPGKIYNQKKVAQIRPRLMRTGFFEQVEEPQVFLAEKNKGGLLIKLKEGKTSRFDGVLGYNPGAGEESGYFTGLLDISLGNLLGTGRSILAHWQKRDQKTQDLKFHYQEPWVAGFPVSVGFGFEQLIQDTTYIQRDIGFDLAMPLLENFTVHTRVAQTEISPDSLGSYLLLIPKSRSLYASIGLSYDTRDDLINPLSGVYYQTSIQSGRKKNLGPEDLILDLLLKKEVDNKNLSLDIEYYGQFVKRQVLALSLHGRQIRSNEEFIPVPDQYRLGGARTLRGYREDQFRGSSIGWLNLEYRYILGRRSRAFVFTDAGYFNSTTQSGYNEAYKMGYGFGFRLETGLGIMGVDYGLGDGDGMFNGKVHVGLINEF